MQSSWVLPLDSAAALGFAAPAHLRPELADRRPLHCRHVPPAACFPTEVPLETRHHFQDVHYTVFNPLEGTLPIRCGACRQMLPQNNWSASENQIQLVLRSPDGGIGIVVCPQLWCTSCSERGFPGT